MSKIIKALNKAQRLNERGYAVTMNHSQEVSQQPLQPTDAFSSGKQNFNYLTLVIPLVVMFVISTFLSYQTLTYLKNTKEVSSFLAKNLAEQKQEIKRLSALVENGNETAAQTIDNANTRIQELQATLSSMEDDLSETTINYNLLKVAVDDLKFTNRSLVEKYISVSDRLITVQEEVNKIQREGREL